MLNNFMKMAKSLNPDFVRLSPDLLCHFPPSVIALYMGPCWKGISARGLLVSWAVP